MFISIESLCFCYDPSVKTVDQFSMKINKGEIISVLGPSGSGKSTLLRLCAGLEVPCEGSFKIEDKVIFDKHLFVQPEKRGIGMVFQDYALFPHMTVADNISFGLKDMKRWDKRNRVREVLELVELTGFEKRFPHQLSGGQQQRVALARAIAPNPSLLLLDEPFSNLDAELQVKIRKDLRAILKKEGITAIFVTHDENDALAIADRIVKLKDGKIKNVGRPCDILGAVQSWEAKRIEKHQEEPMLAKV